MNRMDHEDMYRSSILYPDGKYPQPRPEIKRAYPWEGAHDDRVMSAAMSIATCYTIHRGWLWRLLGDLGLWLVNKAAAHTTYVRKEP